MSNAVRQMLAITRVNLIRASRDRLALFSGDITVHSVC